jgi:hypothetical protein
MKILRLYGLRTFKKIISAKSSLLVKGHTDITSAIIFHHYLSYREPEVA